ncbi:MAG: PAS domain-containing protein [Gammaproteobacteria bacterium]|nr:hypothetical protein [Gammaproteobacteria bacterium]
MGESTDYRRVFEQAPGLFLIVRPDPAFTVVDASDAYLRATFTTRETIVGRGLFDLLPKEPAATRAIAALRLRRSFERVIATGGADAMQIQRFDVLRPGPENGTVERYWSAVNSPVLSADGSLLYILHAIEDVTEFVHSSREEQESGDALRLEILHRGRQLAATNRELREVVSQFQALYEQGLYAARIALDGTLIDANRALLEETGIARQEVIGKPFWECGWWNRSAELQEWVKNAVGRAVGGEPFRGVSVYFRGDGKERIVDFACLPIKDESGIVQFVFSTGMDITERVSAERNLRSTQILESIAEGFFALDAEWRFIYVNREAQRLFGRAPNELIGRKIWTEIGGIEGNEFERVVRLAMDDRIASARVTAFCAEHERWYELQSYPAENGITVYFRDVSAQVVAEAERQRLAAESERAIRERAEALRAADRAKDEFLATLAHELRNPLAPLRNALHLLGTTGAADETSATLIALMDRQLNHLIRLVDDLLEMSRISRGVLMLRKEKVELAEIVRNAVETSKPLIEAARHTLTVTLPGEPLWLDGDPVRLAQIVANLLNNAAKYTEDHGQITVRAERHGDMARISVIDNGIGIDPEDLPRVFEMFSRGPEHRGQIGGLGIGLALARRLATMHGGTVEARSEGRGSGSEFIVRLPLAAPPAAPRKAAAGRELERAGPAPPRILVVDDNRDAAESLAMLLRTFGVEARVACSGAEALRAVDEWSPAAVFLDIGMPQMDGYEAARRIREGHPIVRPMLIALTGWGQQEDRRKAREAGFDRHIVKPAEISVLRELVDSLRG